MIPTFLWLPMTVWLANVVVLVWFGFLLGRYRRDGLLPPKSMRRDLDLMLGRYDHLPRLRTLRWIGIVLTGTFFLLLAWAARQS